MVSAIIMPRGLEKELNVSIPIDKHTDIRRILLRSMLIFYLGKLLIYLND